MAIGDLGPLGLLVGDPGITIVVHAGANDLAELKARYGFAFATIFDTSIAARFLGGRALGLDALLAAYLSVELPPSRQRDDWSRRPLTPAQEDYAAADVRHLFALKARLIEELSRVGRLDWVHEECAALAAQPAPERSNDPNAYLSIRGARDLGPRGQAILKGLHELRDQLARDADRPPFKILADETLLRIALVAPADAAALAGVPGCTPRVIARWGTAVLAAIARGMALPDAELPVLPRPPRRSFSAVAARRADTLRGWRAAAATRFGLDPGLLLPNRLIGAIAGAAPGDLAALATIDGLRRWRIDAFGAEIVAALRSTPTSG